MTALAALQDWYLSQCNEDWEHTYGVAIGTLDNPGWSLKIDLVDTDLAAATYAGRSYGVGADAQSSGHDWMICKVENGQFIAYGGPRKLEEMIAVFLSWAKENA